MKTAILAQTPGADIVDLFPDLPPWDVRASAEAEPGKLSWYRNSNGLVEIAMNRGSASTFAGICVGMQVRVEKDGSASS